MKYLTITLCVAAILVAGSAVAQNAAQARRCAICGRLLGKQCHESVLSRDPDFKKYGMFQICQECLNRRMSRRAQATYIQVAFKYKWNSIAHNLSNVVKFKSR